MNNESLSKNSKQDIQIGKVYELDCPYQGKLKMVVPVVMFGHPGSRVIQCFDLTSHLIVGYHEPLEFRLMGNLKVEYLTNAAA